MMGVNYKYKVAGFVFVLLYTWEDPMCTVHSQGGNQFLVVVDALKEGLVQVTCQPPNSDIESLVWQGIDVNGQAISPVLSTLSSAGYLVLAVPADARFNQSIFTCYAYQASSLQVLSVVIANILFQGPLEPVSNLQFMREAGATASISVSWEAPFSLDLTTAEPDIQYCVDVYNVTEGEDLVESRCDITETFYIFTPDNPSPDNLFNFTVTPRSNVPGGLNGTTSEPVQGFVTVAPLVIPSDSVTSETNASLDPIKFIFPTQVLGTSPGQQPTGYTVDVQSVDDHDQFYCSCPTSHVTVDNTVEITMHCNSSCTPQRHRLFNLTIVAHNNAGSSRSHPEMEISTHDIVKVRAGHSLPQRQIDISCAYLDGATSEGFFTVVYSSANLSDIIYRIAVRNGLESTTNLSITNLRQDKYRLSVYDLVDSIIPEAIPAALPRQVSEVNDTDETIVNGAGTGEPQPTTTLPVSPEVTTPSGGMICISCSFSDPMTTGCVGVIHSADLVNLTLTTINVISHNTSCISLHESGDYLVAVFGQLPNGLETVPALTTTVTVSLDSPTSVLVLDTAIIDTVTGQILGIVLSILSVMLIVIVLLVIVTLMKIKSKSIKVQASAKDDRSGGLAKPGRYTSTETTSNTSYDEIILLKLLPNDHPSRHHDGESPSSKLDFNNQITTQVDKPDDTECVQTGHKVIMVKELTSTGNLQNKPEGSEKSQINNRKKWSRDGTAKIHRRLPPIQCTQPGLRSPSAVSASYVKVDFKN